MGGGRPIRVIERGVRGGAGGQRAAGFGQPPEGTASRPNSVNHPGEGWNCRQRRPAAPSSLGGPAMSETCTILNAPSIAGANADSPDRGRTARGMCPRASAQVSACVAAVYLVGDGPPQGAVIAHLRSFVADAEVHCLLTVSDLTIGLPLGCVDSLLERRRICHVHVGVPNVWHNPIMRTRTEPCCPREDGRVSARLIAGRGPRWAESFLVRRHEHLSLTAEC